MFPSVTQAKICFFYFVLTIHSVSSSNTEEKNIVETEKTISESRLFWFVGRRVGTFNIVHQYTEIKQSNQQIITARDILSYNTQQEHICTSLSFEHIKYNGHVVNSNGHSNIVHTTYATLPRIQPFSCLYLSNVDRNSFIQVGVLSTK